VDYRIRRAKSDLTSNSYVAIAAGQNEGASRGEALFVTEDAFGVVEGVIARHFESYDRAAVNEIPKEVGTRIVAEWRDVAEWLPVLKADEARVALNVATWFGAGFDAELENQRADVIALLRGLAAGCDDFYSRNEWICVRAL
jgi:hypothetical protein